MIYKKLFYDNYKKEFGRVSQTVVDCCDAIIDEFNKHQEEERDIEKKAYMLATVRHEVGEAMIPIIENMNYTAKRITEVWPSRFKSIAAAQPYAHNPQKLANNVYGNRLGNGPAASGDGYRYRGRGIGAQFTGKDQYIKWGRLLGIDLVNHPDLATDLKYGAWVLYKGSVEGLFTGVGLDKYINSNKVDYKNARRVVNADVGRNGAKIAEDAKKFERILRASNITSVTPYKKEEPMTSIGGNTIIYAEPVNKTQESVHETPDVLRKEEKVNTSTTVWDLLVRLIKYAFGKSDDKK